MDFKAYDSKKLGAYAQEAKKRWGHTDAWRESQARGKNADQERTDADGLMDIFRRLGQFRQGDPAAPEAQKAPSGSSSVSVRCTRPVTS